MTEIKYYEVRLTEAEIMRVEVALYDRATILYAIGNRLAYKGDKEGANGMDKRASDLEKIATKIAYPLDVDYIAKYNGSKSNSVS